MKKKILIIDNNQEFLELAEFLLNGRGHEVVASLSPQTLSKLSQINPDLILLDEYLNGIKGHELCLAIKRTVMTKHIPIILLSSAFDIEQIADECLADGFIKKPFDIDYLYEVVEEESYSAPS